MKKFSFFIIVGLFLLTSCGGGSTSKNTKPEAEQVSAVDDANQIIAYTNSLIRFLNQTGSWLESSTNSINEMIRYSKTRKNKPSYIPFSSYSSVSLGDNKILPLPSVLSQEDQSFFSSNFGAYQTTFDRLENNVSDLKKYIDNQDYKDDNYAKGVQLSDSITAQIKYINESKEMLYTRIDAVAEKAEELTLQDHPLKEPILNMKATMRGFDDLYLILAKYNEGNATPEDAATQYQIIETKIGNEKDGYRDILGAKEFRYVDFYKRADNLLSVYRKVLRDVKDKKKITQSTFDSLESQNNSLIVDYNHFVN